VSVAAVRLFVSALPIPVVLVKPTEALSPESSENRHKLDNFSPKTVCVENGTREAFHETESQF
jgi:hypothetical protein